MKRFIIILALPAILLLACEGKQGPIGPQGPQGPSGSTGDLVHTISGTVSNSQYSGNYINIYTSYAHTYSIIQVCVNQDPNVWAWRQIDQIWIIEGRIGIYDPNRDFVGWDYLINIVEN